MSIREYEEIRTIRERFQDKMNFPQFIDIIRVDGLRGWKGEQVQFKFPVVAIAGENGSGKSTILRAAACAYKNRMEEGNYYPGNLFKNTYWDRIEGVTLTYQIRQGADIKSYKITKATERWRPSKKVPERSVIFSDISRLAPIDATVGYAKIAKFTAKEVSSLDISGEYRDSYSFVLGHNYSKARFATSNISDQNEVGLLEREFGEISQFHQGAGESTTLDLFKILQSIPDYSLLIIDEVEGSLHPRAQRRLVRFLLKLSRLKKIQFILSTHSPYILQELPQEGRVLLLPERTGVKVLYGISPEFALSRIDEKDHPELTIYVEDRESEIWLREIISTNLDTDYVLSRLAIRPVGPASAVQVLGQLGAENRLPEKLLAYVDGDQENNQFYIKLPGNNCPEIVVLSGLKELNYPDLPERFGMGSGTLFTILDDAMLDPDPHNWLKLIGDKTRKSSISVWEILTKEWCVNCLSTDERTRIITPIIQKLSS